jgi:hypothetical protein
MATNQKCKTCHGQGVVADHSTISRISDCPDCIGKRICPRCGGELPFPRAFTCSQCGFPFKGGN